MITICQHYLFYWIFDSLPNVNTSERISFVGGETVSFGEELKKLREGRGYTVNQLAMYSGVSSASISRYETGDRGTPKPPTIKKLAKGLKMDYKELMKIAGHVEDEQEEVTTLPKSNVEYVIKEIIEKYEVNLEEPGAKEKLEQIVNLVFGDMKKK
jgi:transcriptional regulator with XRE-family HTH domain